MNIFILFLMTLAGLGTLVIILLKFINVRLQTQFSRKFKEDLLLKFDAQQWIRMWQLIKAGEKFLNIVIVVNLITLNISHLLIDFGPENISTVIIHAILFTLNVTAFFIKRVRPITYDFLMTSLDAHIEYKSPSNETLPSREAFLNAEAAKGIFKHEEWDKLLQHAIFKL